MVDINISGPDRKATFAGTSSPISGVGGPTTAGFLGFNAAANAQQRDASQAFQDQLLRQQELEWMLTQRNMRNDMIKSLVPEINAADTPTSGQVAQSAATQFLGLNQGDMARQLNARASQTNQRQNVADAASTEAGAVSSAADAGFLPVNRQGTPQQLANRPMSFDPRGAGVDEGQTAQQQMMSEIEAQFDSPYVQGRGEMTLEGPIGASNLMQGELRDFTLKGDGPADTGRGGDTGATTSGTETRADKMTPGQTLALRQAQERGATASMDQLQYDQDGNMYVPFSTPSGEVVGVFSQDGTLIGEYDRETQQIVPLEEGNVQ